ncbi:zinc finger CCCH domain-containing protein 45 isoform X2 [Argentina anserina]|nr:zinc finger CCCH domain-containing protein 45 isoform X2 [Potentilla anserina]
MSCDTAKENASVVDSSVTDRKEDMGNGDEPDSSSQKVTEGVEPSRSDEVRHSHDHVGNSPVRKKAKLYGTRYFIIKSLSHENIQLSIEKGIWATQVMNEPILEDAFHNSGKVILIFSVNMSGFFQGYAQMMSSVGWRRDNVWSQGSSRGNPWGRSFKVKWLRLNDLPFQQTLHLKNPLNEYKPVKISRDCQELSPDVGEALCELLDRKNDLNDVNSIDLDDFPTKRPRVDLPCSVVEEEYNLAPVDLSWSQTPMLYPSLFYQHQASTKRFHLANEKCNESRPTSVLTEDDFLEMSYEEYLEVYGRSRKEHYQPGSRSQKSSRSKMHDDDL